MTLEPLGTYPLAEGLMGTLTSGLKEGELPFHHWEPVFFFFNSLSHFLHPGFAIQSQLFSADLKGSFGN